MSHHEGGDSSAEQRPKSRSGGGDSSAIDEASHATTRGSTYSNSGLQPMSTAGSSQLPRHELAVYLAFFAGALAVSGYKFRTQVSNKSILELDATSLKDGFLGYKMDNTYMDFNYFLKSFFPLLGVLTAHLAVSRLTRQFFNLQLHHLACAGFTLALSCWLLSPKCTAMLLCLHLSCACAAVFVYSPAASWAVWAVALLAFLRFNGASFGRELRTRTGLGLDARGAHLFYPISGYLYCRFLSMGLWLAARSKSSHESSAGLLHHLLSSLPASLHYAFYLPNFLGAPVITMEDFVGQLSDSSSRSEVRIPMSQLAWRATRLTLWLLLTLLIVHCFPAGAYLETVGLRLVRSRQPIGFAQLAFAMYTRGQLFMLEYVQYYGWPGLFASLDGVQLPHWPACICRVTSYREMWRLFDRGLFAIVRSHVYIPMGGSRRGLARQLAATAACFGFICLYHGNYDSVQLWILLNLGLVAIELLAVRAYKGGLEVAMLTWLSPRCLRRLIGCLAAANLIPPSLAIFYFFYGTYAGNLFTREILWKPLTGQSSLAAIGIFYATFYCSVQLAIEFKLRRGNANKD